MMFFAEDIAELKNQWQLLVLLIAHQFVILAALITGQNLLLAGASVLLVPIGFVLPISYWIVGFLGTVFVFIELTSTMLLADLVAVIVVCIYWANFLLVEKNPIGPFPKLYPVILFLVGVGISLFDAALPGIATVHYLRYVFLFIMLYTLHHAFLYHISIRKMFGWYLAFSVIASISMIFALMQASSGRTFGFAGGLFNDMLVGANILAFGYLFAENRRFWLRFPLAVFLLLALVLSQTRGSWLSFSLTLIFMSLAMWYKERNFIRGVFLKRMLPLALIMMVLIPAAFAFFPKAQESVQQRVGQTVAVETTGHGAKATSFMTRLLIWHTAVQAFLAHPVNGIGVDMFSFVSGDYYTIHPLLWDYYVRALDPHLLMLAFLSETGLIGTFGLVVLFANFFALALRNYRNAESEEDKADGLLILCSIFFVICSS